MSLARVYYYCQRTANPFVLQSKKRSWQQPTAVGATAVLACFCCPCCPRWRNLIGVLNSNLSSFANSSSSQPCRGGCLYLKTTVCFKQSQLIVRSAVITSVMSVLLCREMRGELFLSGAGHDTGSSKPTYHYRCFALLNFSLDILLYCLRRYIECFRCFCCSL